MTSGLYAEALTSYALAASLRDGRGVAQAEDERMKKGTVPVVHGVENRPEVKDSDLEKMGDQK